VITQDQNHIPWNKNHMRRPRGFSRRRYRSFDRKTSEALGTHHLQATVTMWFLNIWDNVPMDLEYVCQQYFTYMYLLCFIRYNKTFIACEYRKYENVFTHEYYIPLGRCPRGIWYTWVNKFSYFPHQHAINVYCQQP
jgi:hypothetical protein